MLLTLTCQSNALLSVIEIWIFLDRFVMFIADLIPKSDLFLIIIKKV